MFGTRIPIILLVLSLAACSSKPLIPWSNDAPPQVLVPIAEAGIDDQRGRFREVFCAVLDSKGEAWPDYRPCQEALTRVGTEPPGTGQPVNLGKSQKKVLMLIVPGVGWECIENWLDIDASLQELLSSYGFEAELLDVDGLSSSANNARQIKEYIDAIPPELQEHEIVLIGYSKGAPDILEAVVGTGLPDQPGNPPLALDLFHVRDSSGRAIPTDDPQWKRIEQDLHDLIVAEESGPQARELISRRQSSGLQSRVTPGVPTTIKVNNTASSDYSIVEVFTRNHLGVLHEITRSLAAMGLDIHLAKISSEGERATDAFYVADARAMTAGHASGKLGAERIAEVEMRLREALGEDDD